MIWRNLLADRRELTPRQFEAAWHDAVNAAMYRRALAAGPSPCRVL
jgi:hypothetical protein